MSKILSILLETFENDNRVFKVADTLRRSGHEVIVVAVAREGLPREELYHGVTVHRLFLRSMNPKSQGKWLRFRRFFEFARLIYSRYPDAEILHCNDIEGLVAGGLVRLFRRKLKLVYDSHEYQREKFGMSGLQRVFIGLTERFFIPRCETVITVSRPIASEYERLYKLSHVHVLINAPHRGPVIERSNVLRQEFGLDDTSVLCIYQGKFADSRGVEVLLEAFSEERFKQDHIVFMGSGKYGEAIRNAALISTNIHLRDAVPYHELLRYTASADFGFVSTQNLCLNNYMCLPNKLFEYIQAGVPVITNNLVECARIVQEEGIGTVIPEYTPDGIWDALQRAKNMDCTILRSNLSKAREKYSWENQEGVLLDIYKRIIS